MASIGWLESRLQRRLVETRLSDPEVAAVKELLFGLRRRKVRRRWAQGRLNYSSARWHLQRLARN